MSGAETGRSALGALAHRDFRLVWLGLVVSNNGTWMQQFALGWFVVQLAAREGTPNLAPLYLGFMGLARALPGLASGLFAGVLVDRADRRRLLFITQSFGAAAAAALALLVVTDRATLPVILAVVGLAGASHAVDATARHTVVPRLVPEGALVSAIGLNNMAQNSAALLGPLIGGILIAPIGVGGIMAVNALSYSATILALVLVRFPERPAAKRGSVLGELREGFAFILREPAVRWSMILTAVASLLARSFPQLLPAIAHDVLHVGAVELSWLLSAAGAGALVGALGAASLGRVRSHGFVATCSAIVLGGCVMALGLQRELAGAIVAVAGAAIASIIFTSMNAAVFQLRTPDRLRGRVVGAGAMAILGMVPLGQMLLGTLGSVIGIDAAMLAGGAALAAVAVLILFRAPEVREASAPEGAPR